jgi:hypothetical protein
MPSYIVECQSCHQPWKVPTLLLTTAEWKIIVPGHMALNLETSEAEPNACAGAAFSGLGMGERDEWERHWAIRYPGRPMPLVLDGSVITVQVRN